MNATTTDSGDHRVEQTVEVYLRFEDGRWVIDPVTLDGFALDTVRGTGSSTSECECGSPDECRAAREAADAVDPPTGRQLHTLLGEAINNRSIETTRIEKE